MGKPQKSESGGFEDMAWGADAPWSRRLGKLLLAGLLLFGAYILLMWLTEDLWTLI